MKAQFKRSDIKDRLIFSLFFKSNPEVKGVLDLYLSGSVATSFEIETETPDENGNKQFFQEPNGLLVDKVSVVPNKSLQQLIDKHLKVEELEEIVGDKMAGQIKELIDLFYKKLNKIYAKSKLYGREIKNFKLN